MKPILSDIRVLDLTRVLAGPWCTQLLSDYGAEVIKVESPDGGDDARKIPPFYPEADASGEQQAEPMSAFFACANRGKHSLIIDIKTEEGQREIHELIKSCDVIVENFKVGNLKKYNLDYASIQAINPDIIYCSITGYGQTGPMASHPGYDLLFQGISGAMSTCGLPDSVPGGGPMRTIVPHTDLMTGMYACNSILAAIMHRQQTGEGQYLDVALLDVAIAANSYVGGGYLASGQSFGRIGNSGVAASPSGVYPCKDGWVIVQCNDRHWPLLCDCLEQDDWKNDPRFSNLLDRLKNAGEIDKLITDITRQYLKKDFAQKVADVGIPCVPVNSIGEAFAEPQVIHRGLVVDTELADGRTVPIVRNPVIFSKMKLRSDPPPSYGSIKKEN